QVAFGYDTQGRLGSITAPHGVTTLAYDPTTGQLASITTPDGQQLSYIHDGFLETGVTWAGTVAGSVTRAYNADFRVTETKVNGALPVSYAYDADGLLTVAGGLTITRDPQNGLITGTAIGAVTDTRTTNAFGEPTGLTATVSGSPVLSTNFTRDSLGRISQKVETIQGQTTTFDYTYDAAGRLWQVLKTPQGGAPLTTTYAYDANGNRLSKTDQTGTVTATVDAQDRLLTYGDTTYQYNAHGDLTSKTQNGATVTYDYDVFGNLRHATLDSGIEIDYVIDGRHRRIGKKVNGTLVQGFLYDDQLRIAAELDGVGAVVSRFAYGTHVNVPELIVKGATTYRIVHDHLGSPRLVINTADGSIAQRLDFDEFGIVTLDTNPGFQPFGFAGGLNDPQTKLVRFGARDYDAQTGRWTAKEPLGFVGLEKNRFAYSGSDPVNHHDPTGLLVWICNRRSARLGNFQANHAYLWFPRNGNPFGGISCGMQWVCGGRPESAWNQENGPATDNCAPVLGSTPFEDLILRCCAKTANSGAWAPPFRDCHNAAQRCLKKYGLWAEVPGGRLSTPDMGVTLYD
ncbi:MAG: RHS repeat domain-containing protein, partial [Acidobacteriota bacterium]